MRKKLGAGVLEEVRRRGIKPDHLGDISETRPLQSASATSARYQTPLGFDFCRHRQTQHRSFLLSSKNQSSLFYDHLGKVSVCLHTGRVDTSNNRFAYLDNIKLPVVQECKCLDWKSNLINTEAHSCNLISPASIKSGFKWAVLQYKQGQGEYIKTVLTVDPPGPWELGQAWSSMNFHILGRSPSAAPKRQNKTGQIK